MTKDDIIRTAHEAGLHIATDVNWMPIIGLKYLEKFAALVAEEASKAAAAAEREKMKWDGIHTCHDQCQRPACVWVRKAVKEEREACAKVCEELFRREPPYTSYAEGAQDCADAIRARGQK